MKSLTLLLAFLFACSAQAQNWSIGAGTGPFVFGDFVKRTLRIATETGSIEQTLTLSAATRAGLAVDLERSFSDRFAVRVEATFTRAPLAIKGDDGDEGVTIGAGDLDVATFMLPLVFRINPRGTFRFHLMGGPAYARYRIEPQDNAPSSIRLFAGARSAWGLALGGGVAWQLSDRFALEGQVTDIATASPFRESELGLIGRTEFPHPHNVHTTAGVRYKF